MIHLGNYEEFFVLYIDNELSDAEMKKVDDFLAAHPDLQAEFEILAGTRLPMEEFTFDKSELMADKMKLGTIDEDLLLYIDQELPSGKRKVVELELASNPDYQLQHQLLLKTKLDATDKISYPDKKELYRRSETKVIGIGVWMRIAVAVMLVASMTILYFNNSSNTSTTPTVAATGKEPVKKESVEQITPDVHSSNEEPVLAKTEEKPELKIINKKGNAVENKKTGTEEFQDAEPQPRDLYVAQADHNLPDKARMETLDLNTPGLTTGQIDINRDNGSLNNIPVTTTTPEPYNNSDATPTNIDVASNNNENKGSVKGFLRRATRLIEKRTGIDATNDGELLIGVVAVKLK